MVMLCLALLVLGQSVAHAAVVRDLPASLNVKEQVKTASPPAKVKAAPVPAKTAPAATAKVEAAPVPPHALVTAPLNPPLKDVKSDKKFFGPPFPADYPEDKRPVVQKSILDKLKGPDQPYPALQSKKDFDTDYVKDENSDKGAWKAQFEYDALRKKLNKEESDEKAAENRAAKEGRDVDDAQRKADEAGKNADDARKGADDANRKDSETGGSTDDAGGKVEDVAPSQAELEKLKKKVAEAEESYEKEKKDFEECERQLEEAKKAVEDLKKKQAEMEGNLAGDTKLWAESKTVRFNLHKAKEEAAAAKRLAAEARLKVAQNNKEDLDKALAKEKLESQEAQKNLQKEKAELEQFHKNLAKATLNLQKLRGYAPVVAAPAKSASWFGWLR